VRYLDLADYLYLAGAALDSAPQAVFDVADLGLAKNHPLSDGNKRAAYLAMIEFLARNGRQFLATDVGAAIDMMVKIAGSEVDPAEIEDWIRRQLD
jgi:death-on-curing family protein